MAMMRFQRSARSSLTSSSRRKRGNDGLTDAERADYAACWNTGAGATPTSDEMQRLRRQAATRPTA